MGAIPIPMNAVRIPKAITEVSANIARRVLPTMLMKKLNSKVPNGFSFIEIKMATNLIAAKDPQRTAVILAPIFLNRCQGFYYFFNIFKRLFTDLQQRTFLFTILLLHTYGSTWIFCRHCIMLWFIIGINRFVSN